jgi:molybdopterin-guanine dinucleotide biosynthesis protein A
LLHFDDALLDGACADELVDEDGSRLADAVGAITRLRFGGGIPKQYQDVAGRPLLAHTLEALLSHAAVAGVVVAVGEGDEWWPGWSEFAGKPVLTCTGGDSRAASVLAALETLPESVRADDFVLVHDAARPNLAQADLDAGRAGSESSNPHLKQAAAEIEAASDERLEALKRERLHLLDEIAALIDQQQPGIALAMTAFALSALGLPPFSGFWAKFWSSLKLRMTDRIPARAATRPNSPYLSAPFAGP